MDPCYLFQCYCHIREVLVSWWEQLNPSQERKKLQKAKKNLHEDLENCHQLGPVDFYHKIWLIGVMSSGNQAKSEIKIIAKYLILFLWA